MTRDERAPEGRDGECNRGQREAGAEEEAGNGVRGLPGVVNDLPEVAPHEWIDLMS